MRSVKSRPQGAKSKLAAHQSVYRLALADAGSHDSLEYGERALRERAILERGCVDVHIEGGAARRRIGGRYSNARVADHSEIAVLTGAARQANDLGAVAGAGERDLSGAFETGLNGERPPLLVLVRVFRQLVRGHQFIEGRDIVGHHPR